MSNTKNSAIKNITAALLCVALAIGAGCAIKRHEDKKAAASLLNLKSAETYDEVYNKINSLKLKTNILYGLKNGMAKGSSRNEKAEYIEDSNTSAATNGASETAKADYSKTTTQVEGVDEADIVKTDGKYITICDRKDAIKYAIEHGQPGDVIVLAGKGHETYQEIKGVKHDMDERALIKEVLEELHVR